MLEQNIFVWRAGAAYDLFGNGSTALKSSYSRYGLQTGIDRVTQVNPLTAGSRTCPWTDPNSDGRYQVGGGEPGTLHAVQRRHLDLLRPGRRVAVLGRVTAGIEQQLPGACASARSSTTTPTASSSASATWPSRPAPTRRSTTPRPIVRRHDRQPDVGHGDHLQHRPDAGQRDRQRQRQSVLPRPGTRASNSPPKRFTHNWQMVDGLTIGKTTGDVNAALAQSASGEAAPTT